MVHSITGIGTSALKAQKEKVIHLAWESLPKQVALIWALKDEEMGKYLLGREEKKREELLVDVSDNNDAHL